MQSFSDKIKTDVGCVSLWSQMSNLFKSSCFRLHWVKSYWLWILGILSGVSESLGMIVIIEIDHEIMMFIATYLK